MNLPLILLQLLLYLPKDNTYLVGGCVRDYLLGKQPKDFDIVTNTDLDSLILNLKDNGWKIKEEGKQFLVLIVSKDSQQFEIALYRKDGTYTDGRRPDSVQVGTILEDALRRDLTINSLYYNPWTGNIVDPTSLGIMDLQRNIIRFNGKATKRIEEDYLRIFRVYRFASQLGFKIEPNTLRACRTHFETACKTISGQRILAEVEKMAWK